MILWLGLTKSLFCHSNSNKPDLLARNKFPGKFSRIYENLACVKKTWLIFGLKVVKFHLAKASYHNFEDFVSPVWWNDCFWQSAVFTKFWNFYTKSNIFNILLNIFIFYCWYPFNHELSVFICVIVMCLYVL